MRLYLLIFILFGGFLFVMTKKTIRGIRNNNPLNIRKGNNWQGESSVSRAFNR